MREGSLNEKKVCFITCVSDEPMYAESLKYLQALELPTGMETEYIAVRGASSLTSGYQQAMEASDAKYKLYLHQDVFIQYRKAIIKLVHEFQTHLEYGIAGVAGCVDLPANGIWWEAQQRAGAVYDEHSGTMKAYRFGGKRNQCTEVMALDGILLATQYDVNWRMDLLTSWHFYDISQCQEFRRRNYKAVVVPQMTPWCVHKCGQEYKSGMDWAKGDYTVAQRIFLEEYRKDIMQQV